MFQRSKCQENRINFILETETVVCAYLTYVQFFIPLLLKPAYSLHIDILQYLSSTHRSSISMGYSDTKTVLQCAVRYFSADCVNTCASHVTGNPTINEDGVASLFAGRVFCSFALSSDIWDGKAPNERGDKF